MAIAEYVGNDRRGNPIYRRDAAGFEISELFEIEFPVLRSGKEVVEKRTIQRRQVADDLPLIVGKYRNWVEGGMVSDSRASSGV